MPVEGPMQFKNPHYKTSIIKSQTKFNNQNHTYLVYQYGI